MTKTFLLDLGERALRSFAGALLGAITAGLTVATIHWPAALAVAGTAALVSALTSLASIPVSGNQDASLLRSTGTGRHEVRQ